MPLTPVEGDQTEESVYDGPSKSQLKRDMLALQALGKELAELPKEAFRKLPLPEPLLDALTDARKITNHEGLRRQMQYVGKVMRRLTEEEVEAIKTVLNAIKGLSRVETVKLHTIERWRDQLIASDPALTDFLQRYPGADIQEGRTLIRNARREAEQKRSPRYYRELFQWVKAGLAQASKAGQGDDADHEDAEDEDDDERYED